MAWNGSGVFARIHNWVTDRDSAIDITASRMDAEQDGIAAGITACLAKNGENAATAALPMGGFRHTGVGNASARDNYAAAGQVQDGGFLYAADSGVADAYVMTIAPAITAYATGQIFLMKAGNTNTGASVIDINGVGSKALVDEANNALGAGYIVSGQFYSLIYDGTSFRVTWQERLTKATQTIVDAGTNDTDYITPLKLTAAPQLYRRNLLINAQMTGARRGTSFAAAANGDYTLDRWEYTKVGAMVHTVSQETDVPTIAEAGVKLTHSILIDCTTIDSSIAVGDYCTVGQKVQGLTFRAIAGLGSACGFWHKHTKTGVHCVSFRNSGNDRSFVQEYTQTTTDTWEYSEVLILASPSAGTWDYSTGIGLNVTFALACGSTFQTTAGAWQTGNYLATSSQVNDCDSTSNNFRIAAPQLEKGDVATPFDMRPQEFDDLLSSWFHRRVKSFGINGIVSATTSFRFTMFVPEMRDTPIVTLLDTNPNIVYGNSSAAGSSATLSATTISNMGFRGTINGFTGLTVGDACFITDNQEIFDINAEL